MKKALAIVVAIVFILTASAGCGGGSDAGGGDGGGAGGAPAEAEVAAVDEHQHVWTDATHQSPKTCSECGETDGGPIPHEWIEANYQEPKTCEECGETEGEPLPPAFTSLGFELKDIGASYTYKSCYEDMSDASGEAIVTDVRVMDGDDYYDPKDGYEWVIATCAIEVPESPKVFEIGLEKTDYYSYDLGTVLPVNTVNYYGVDYEVGSKTQILENTATKMAFEIGYLVPSGYDGVIFFLFNDYNSMALDYDDPDLVVTYGDYIDGDTLFFRLR
ncbi:MAG: hypothetical protein FWG03_07985 [Clostridiales bacterium]|nr:hypothetical protein [Clostridiales bacterium]